MKTEQDFEHHTSTEGCNVEKLDLLERRHHKGWGKGWTRGENPFKGTGDGITWAFASSRKGTTVVGFRVRRVIPHIRKQKDLLCDHSSVLEYAPA